jgi:hypothetical protein
MTTARSLLTRSLRKGGIIAKNQTPTAGELNDALEDFNSMLGLWSNNEMLIVARVLEGFTLTPSDLDYTIGVGGNFNTSRPQFITSAFVRDGTTDHPVTVVSDAAYASIAYKTQPGLPSSLNYSNANPLATIRLHPVPVSAYTLYLWSEKAITSIATLDTVLAFPPGWEDALMYNATIRLAAEYGQEVDALTLEFARDGKAMIQDAIRRNIPLDWTAPAAQGNVLSGYF